MKTWVSHHLSPLHHFASRGRAHMVVGSFRCESKPCVLHLGLWQKKVLLSPTGGFNSSTKIGVCIFWHSQPPGAIENFGEAVCSAPFPSLATTAIPRIASCFIFLSYQLAFFCHLCNMCKILLL